MQGVGIRKIVVHVPKCFKNAIACAIISLRKLIALAAEYTLGKKLLFVHGTGVRKAGYDASIAKIEQRLAASGLDIALEQCRWGETHGIGSETALSVPWYGDSGGKSGLSEADFLWNVLMHNPAVEMEQLLHSERKPGRPDQDDRDGFIERLRELAVLQPQCFADDGLADLLPAAVGQVEADYERHLKDADGLFREADLGVVLARATVARLFRLAAEQRRDVPVIERRRVLIDAVDERIVGESRGFATVMSKPVLAVLTPLIVSYRGMLTDMVRNQLGDILRYQARGDQIRSFIAERLHMLADDEVYILAHSLGGIASLETLIEYQPRNVKALVTFGSQAPLLYELGALSKLGPRCHLPGNVPPWLNFYDLNDPLSYRAGELFPGRALDHQINSGADFVAAHSAYLESDRMWQLIFDQVT